MLVQFAGLVRKTVPGGHDTVNHPDAHHDDLCNAAAGALVLASLEGEPLTFHPPPEGIGRAAFIDAYVSNVFADRQTGLPPVIASAAYPGGDMTAKPGGAAPGDTTALFFAGGYGHWTPNSSKIAAARAATFQPPAPQRVNRRGRAADVELGARGPRGP